MTACDAVAGPADAPRRPAARAHAASRADDPSLSADLQAAREGDESAFSRVYRAVQPGLLRYLSVLVGSQAEDIASETWAQACRDLPRFRGDIDGFRGWIARIGRNRAIDHQRATARRPRSAGELDDLSMPASHESAETLVIESMTTRAAIAAIAALPRDQAEAVLLRAVLGLDAASAGKVLGKRAGAVRTAAYRGLQTLAKRLDAPGDAGAPVDRSGPGDVSGRRDADEAR